MVVVLVEEGESDGLLDCLGKVLYENVGIPGEDGIDFGHVFERHEYLAGLLCEILVVVDDVFDGDALLVALQLGGLEVGAAEVVLLQHTDELVVVDEVSFGADEGLDDLFFETEDGLFVVFGLYFQLLLDAVDVFVFEHDEFFDESLFEDLLRDFEVDHWVVYI